jgi:hypothetical protein
MAWNLMPKHKNGLIPVTQQKFEVQLPEKLVEFQREVKAVKKKVVAIDKNKPISQSEGSTPFDRRAEIETMKEELKVAGIRLPNIGYEKLKQKYNDYRKQKD